MTGNHSDRWSNRPWPYWFGLFVLALFVAYMEIDWFKALEWWGKGAAPHESLRNLGLILAGFFGIALATWRSTVAAAQAKTAQQGHITDRFSKAVEHLGSTNISVRIGGIFALKRIAEDSLERDHISVMDVLTSFICHSPYGNLQREAIDLALKNDEYTKQALGDQEFANNTKPPPPPRFIDCPDIIVAIDTIQTRSDDQKSLEAAKKYTPSLKNADFSYLILNDVDLSGFDLNGVNIKDANLLGVNLSNADLSGYDLQGGIELSDASLSGIDLSDSDLCGAILQGAILERAKLARSDFSNADLSSANLASADLSGANLSSANLSNANLTEANLEGADLTGANLSGANLSNANLLDTCLLGTNLSLAGLEYFHYESHPPEGLELSREDFELVKNNPDLSNAFTYPGKPPSNLLDSINPPPERDED